MNIHGGCAVGEELADLDGCETALLLINGGGEVVTPYGVVYDNGMKLEPLYDGQHFPSYLYKSPVMALETVSGSGAEGYFCLPMPDRQMQRIIERAGLENQSVPMRIVMDGLPEKVAEALDLESLSLDDILDGVLAPLTNSREDAGAALLVTETLRHSANRNAECGRPRPHSVWAIRVRTFSSILEQLHHRDI